jgi:hypothetical protein
MMLHPGILALLAGTGTVFLLALYGCGVGLHILCRWDLRSSSEVQLRLERKTWLVSALVGAALAFEIASGLLFVRTADALHPLFVGAMCATGVLNLHPAGWQTLYTKIAVFFAAALWLALNRLDQRAEDFPLVRLKYALLLPLTMLVGLDLWFQTRFFLALQPNVITSCCGSLFAQAGAGVAAELAALPAGPTMAVFYLTAALFLGATLLCLYRPAGALRYLLSGVAGLTFFVALAAIVSFLSLYIYELPTHHCPFDIFQADYHYLGYPFYGLLFGGVLFGLLPGLFQPLQRISSLRADLLRAERTWLRLALGFMTGFLVLASWPVLFGAFNLIR